MLEHSQRLISDVHAFRSRLEICFAAGRSWKEIKCGVETEQGRDLEDERERGEMIDIWKFKEEGASLMTGDELVLYSSEVRLEISMRVSWIPWRIGLTYDAAGQCKQKLCLCECCLYV